MSLCKNSKIKFLQKVQNLNLIVYPWMNLVKYHSKNSIKLNYAIMIIKKNLFVKNSCNISANMKCLKAGRKFFQLNQKANSLGFLYSNQIKHKPNILNLSCNLINNLA
ncbi:hypothetical protein BpHYR1_004466 [Brachionus plicatilis]|uniref:Uncharacterized protein n=1 Tax=Brachionus plicatilis TaxID=10195 RepID=A0A3M7SA58_BRAPC|nr:hypothetical protein BpHYR1_004466 [Brachionus plicatilis]